MFTEQVVKYRCVNNEIVFDLPFSGVHKVEEVSLLIAAHQRLEMRDFVILVKTSASESLQAINPTWPYSDSLGSIFHYVRTGEDSLVFQVPYLRFSADVELSLMVWNKKKDLKISEYIDDIYIGRKTENTTYFERIGQA